MSVNELLSWFGTLIGIFGLAYAFYESRQRKKLADLVRANNWFMYQRTDNSNGSVQLSLSVYKKKHAENLDPEVIEWLSKSDAWGQEVHKEIIRQIQVFEPSFTDNDFDRWKNEGKIDEKKVQLFRQFAVYSSKNS